MNKENNQQNNKVKKLVWYSDGLLNRGQWDRYPPSPLFWEYWTIGCLTDCKSVASALGVRIPLFPQWYISSVSVRVRYNDKNHSVTLWCIQPILIRSRTCNWYCKCGFKSHHHNKTQRGTLVISMVISMGYLK
jgi:hypothetical protein